MGTTCDQCGITLMDNTPNDTDGYFYLNRVTNTEDIDWSFCGSDCLKAFIDEAMSA